MPRFKTTDNILNNVTEYFDINWMDSNKIILPTKENWDYKRELKLEDIDLWEVIAEKNHAGIYAAWSPYAEFYLIVYGNNPSFVLRASDIELGKAKATDQYKIYETVYGKNSQKKVKEKAIEMGIVLFDVPIWIDNNDMWLYS
jgi:hypothetical protein